MWEPLGTPLPQALTCMPTLRKSRPELLHILPQIEGVSRRRNRRPGWLRRSFRRSCRDAAHRHNEPGHIEVAVRIMLCLGVRNRLATRVGVLLYQPCMPKTSVSCYLSVAAEVFKTGATTSLCLCTLL